MATTEMRRLEVDIRFRLVQLQVMQEEGGPHRAARLVQRLAALHRELDHLEARREVLRQQENGQ